MKALFVIAFIAFLTACNPAQTDAPVNQTAKQTTDHQTAKHNEAHNAQHGSHNHTIYPLEDTSHAAARSESVYLVGGDWKDQNGNAFELDTLTGKKQVVALVYTSCKQACPIMVHTMRRIQDKLPIDVKDNTEFLLISFDPERDTPNVLNEFAHHFKLDDKWRLLNGSDSDVRMIANTMNIRYVPSENGEFSHSNAISVLDENGKMIEQAVGTGAGETAIIQALTTQKAS